MISAQESRIKKMAEMRYQNQREAAKAAGLGEMPTNFLLFTLQDFAAVSCSAIFAIPRHLQDMAMKMFLDESELVASVQEKYKELSPENKLRLQEMVSEQAQLHNEVLDRERVSGDERNKVQIFLFMLNTWMMRTHESMASLGISSLFAKLAVEQFRELVEIHNMGQN